MTDALSALLDALDIRPVLMDVGAAGGAPALWGKIASRSVYVGFDPDEREMRDGDFGRFSRTVVLNKAVTDDAGAGSVRFYLTRSPQCSSTLRPDADALSAYLFSGEFIVEGQTDAPATTLGDTLDRLALAGVDWVKMDTQGTDLRLFSSLPPAVRSRTLAVDLEPGLIHAYQGEDLFAETHDRLTADGFWLSRLSVHGSVRIQGGTRDELARLHPHMGVSVLGGAVRTSPGWVEARYLRTVEALDGREAAPRDYGLLWVFALLDGQPGFALDLARAYRRRFGDDEAARRMYGEPLRRLRAAVRRRQMRRAALLPVRILRRIGDVWRRKQT